MEKKKGRGSMRRNCEDKNSAERKQHSVKECVMRNELSAASAFLNFLDGTFHPRECGAHTLG